MNRCQRAVCLHPREEVVPDGFHDLSQILDVRPEIADLQRVICTIKGKERNVAPAAGIQDGIIFRPGVFCAVKCDSGALQKIKGFGNRRVQDMPDLPVEVVIVGIGRTDHGRRHLVQSDNYRQRRR